MTFKNTMNYEFKNPLLLEQALTHKSYYNEHSEESPGHNERFEFLGDAVLDLSISDLLMKSFPEAQEGELSKRRSALVNESTLAKIAIEHKLNEQLRLGKGELQTGGAKKPRLLASVFEAYIGGVFLDSNFETSDEFIKKLFTPYLDDSALGSYQEQDYKTRLQELCQEKHRRAPEYIVKGDEGPDHDKTFYVEVRVNGDVFASGEGKSKKQAEQNAAQKALEKL